MTNSGETLGSAGTEPRANQNNSTNQYDRAQPHKSQALRHRRYPPYSRELRLAGEVTILVGGAPWRARATILERAGVPAIILPPDRDPSEFLWPVSGRHVRVVDLDNVPIGDGRAIRAGWLRYLSGVLLACGAKSVNVASDSGGVQYLDQRGAL